MNKLITLIESANNERAKLGLAGKIGYEIDRTKGSAVKQFHIVTIDDTTGKHTDISGTLFGVGAACLAVHMYTMGLMDQPH